MKSSFNSNKLSKLARFGPSHSRCPTFPKGFLASGVYCGIKKSHQDPNAPGQRDLALIVSTRNDTASAGCFTRNLFKAAPVKYSIETLLQKRGSGIRAVVVNSGCANAVTGSQGSSDAAEMARTLDGLLNLNENRHRTSLVLSTGVIGQLLPMERIRKGILDGHKNLNDSYEAWLAAAEAFMTTDTFPKLLTHSFKLANQEIRIVGIDKGAGMIHPSMGPPHATLLGLIATDAAIQPDSLQIALNRAVERSFNQISVDGDMSTNDTILALANGAAGNQLISHITHPIEFSLFEDQLCQFALQLAKLVVRDGEGATKFVQVKVIGAQTEEDASKVASTVSKSSLVKCALNGQDANWGRILSAVGYSQANGINPSKVSVSFVSTAGVELKLLVNGEPENVDEEKASQILHEEDLEIVINLGNQNGFQSSYFTCDLSKEYVAINGDYRS
ncbi:hypothetical protein O181_044373 [Austropuccinia psidii MF-1]|uniref:Arginine biosynthesis bifunctional protein ArgJ, mitochondrial n=1 Tax=Austropuccinia psidii MF-1 TaxID=1389203 RepID=A0A9Q3DPY9_9BASI|nr:hypothetical protein [Austropuccinia psidii MF-1]